MGAVLVLYLGTGLSMYLSERLSRRAIHLCPPGTTIPAPSGMVPDCHAQTLPLRYEITTGLTLTALGPSLLFAHTPAGVWLASLLFAPRHAQPVAPVKELEMPNARPWGEAAKAADILGTYREAVAQGGRKTFTLPDEATGASFSYPEQYLLFERGSPTSTAEAYSVALFPDSPLVREIMSGKEFLGEGPPGITFLFFRLPSQSTSLETWVRQNTRYSNFAPNDPASDSVLTPATVGGMPALSYRSEGLYSLEQVAISYRNWIVLASAAYGSQEHDTADFISILASLRFPGLSNDERIAACYTYRPGCGACTPVPNNSVRHVKETERHFINMPKDVYPKDISHSWTTVSGNATGGYVSNGGLPGEAQGVLSGCWSTYVDFEGSGEVDLRVKSAVEGVPDYFVRFFVEAI